MSLLHHLSYNGSSSQIQSMIRCQIAMHTFISHTTQAKCVEVCLLFSPPSFHMSMPFFPCLPSPSVPSPENPSFLRCGITVRPPSSSRLVLSFHVGPFIQRPTKSQTQPAASPMASLPQKAATSSWDSTGHSKSLCHKVKYLPFLLIFLLVLIL